MIKKDEGTFEKREIAHRWPRSAAEYVAHIDEQNTIGKVMIVWQLMAPTQLRYGLLES